MLLSVVALCCCVLMPPCSLLLIFVVEVVEVVGRPSWGAPEGATVPSEQLQSLEGVRSVEVTGSGVSRSLKRILREDVLVGFLGGLWVSLILGFCLRWRGTGAHCACVCVLLWLFRARCRT
jgi:hypothetical protein